MYLHLPEDIIQSACIQFQGIEIIFLFTKKIMYPIYISSYFCFGP